MRASLGCRGLPRMIRHIVCRALLSLVLGCFALAVRSEPVAGLYEADVPIASQDEAARAAAVQAGFRTVMLKVAGSSRALDNPAVASALARANNYLLQFYFTQVRYPPRDAVSTPAPTLALHVAFPPRSVDGILRSAGEPVLPANRPATLLWLVIDDGSGQRLVSRALDTLVADWLSFHAAQRAMPLLFPQMDLEDTAAVTPEQVWALETEGPRQAAARYGTESVLVGKLVRASDGSWLGEWRQTLGEESVDGQGQAADFDALAARMVDAIAESVAARYAVQTGLQATEQLRLRVDGVAGFAAYRQLSALLAGMTSVRGVQLVLIDRDTLFFDLVSDSSYESVARELSLLRQLQGEGAEGELRFRWAGG